MHLGFDLVYFSMPCAKAKDTCLCQHIGCQGFGDSGYLSMNHGLTDWVCVSMHHGLLDWVYISV